MARDKTDKTDKTPAATPTASATNEFKPYNRGKDGTHPLDKSFKPRLEGVAEELGGDELQKLRVTWSNEISLFAEGDFWRDLETILTNCDEIMLRHGWDRTAGNGRDFPGDRTAEPFSELWYAGKIGFECWNMLTWHRDHGPNEIALSQALYLGRLLSEAEWRAAFKPSILTGQSQRKTLSEHRNTAIENRRSAAQVRREIIKQMLRQKNLSGGALENYLQRRLRDEEDIYISLRTVRRDLSTI